MTENYVTYIGLLAAFCTSVSFIPQAYRTVKTKHTKDISLTMYLIFVTGVIAWLSYGILLKDIPIIVANIPTLIFSGIVLTMKIKNG